MASLIRDIANGDGHEIGSLGCNCGITRWATHAADDNAAFPHEPASCHVTKPNGGEYENDSLSVGLSGKYVFRPGGPGFVDSDGALGIKVLWTRKKKGLLQVGGKRLDGVAPPARAYLYDYGAKQELAHLPGFSHARMLADYR